MTCLVLMDALDLLASYNSSIFTLTLAHYSLWRAVMSDNKSSRFSACIFSSSCDFYLFSAQMGAGGFSVSLPCRSRSGCLFVSRQPDKGRRPGLQQRGQLHVTSNLFNARRPAAQVTIRSDHRTSTRHEAHRQRQSDVAQQLFYCRHCLNISLKHVQAEVQFAHSDWGRSF